MALPAGQEGAPHARPAVPRLNEDSSTRISKPGRASLLAPGTSQAVLINVSTERRQTLEDGKKPAPAPRPGPPANSGPQGQGGGGGLNHCPRVTHTTSSHIQVFPPRQEHALVDAPSTAPVKARTADRLPCGPGSHWSQQGWVVTPVVTLRRTHAHARAQPAASERAPGGHRRHSRA